MTTYNTGNPIGSTDARDLYDNAQNLDTAMNSTGSTWTDRRGVTRKTFKAAENAADQAEAAANTAINTTIPGYVTAVDSTKNTAINTTIPGYVAAVEARKNTAINSEIPAAVALVDTAVAAMAAGAASAAKVAAEAARDAAQLAAGVYATTAAGLAATTNGQYFNVPASSVNDSLILYLNSSGSAVEVKRYPSAAAVSALQQNAYGPAFVVTDQSKNRVLEVQRSGGFRTKLVNISGSMTSAGSVNLETGSTLTAKSGSNVTYTATSSIETPTSIAGNTLGSPNYVFAVSDEKGNAVLAVNDKGQLVANFDLVPTSSITQTGPLYDFSINQIFGCGQSLSVGQAYPAISTSQSYDNLMFTRGMRPQYDYSTETASQWYASLVPAVEANAPDGTAWAGVLAETPSLGTSDMIKERILTEDGKSYTQHQYQILISTPGYGATTIGELSKGGVHFARMVEQATYGKALANAAGKTHAVQAVTWTQGESDYLAGTSRSAYSAVLDKLIADTNTDIKSATGQNKHIPFISYQIASHIYYGTGAKRPEIALAQLDVENSNSLYCIACAMYQFRYHTGGHLSNVSTRWLGGYYGLAYKRVVINGEDWKPLKPLAAVRQSNIVEMRFHVPHGKLTMDTTQVAAQPNYGFSLVDQNGAAMTINSVEIIDTDRVRISTSATISAGAKVRYAFTGDSAVGKGNLRDTQGDAITFAIPGSAAKRMDNWCLIFEMEI